MNIDWKGWMESEKKSLNSNIKLTKNGLFGQFALLIVNVIGILFNIYILKNNSSSQWLYFVANGFGIGAFLSNLLWTLAFTGKLFSDINNYKYQLRYIEELELKENIKGDIEMYQQSKRNYDSLADDYRKALDELQQNKPPGAHGSSPTGRVNFSMEQPTSLRDCDLF